jgi:hypothetical protein
VHLPARLPICRAALLALLLALTACSDGGGGENASSNDSTSAEATTSPTGSPSASPTASDTEAAEPGVPEVPDPCQMVPEETWQQLVPTKRRSHVVLERIFTTSSGILISDSRVRYACAVTFKDNDNTAMIWGYYPGKFTADDLEKLLDSAGGTVISDQLGFPAVTSGDFVSSDAYGIVGTTGLFVTISEKTDSVVSGGRAKDRVLIAMLGALGEQMESTEPQPKVLLPEFCPAVDSPEVVAVRGRVDYARGGDDGSGHQWCLYRDVRAGADLRLEAYHFTDEYFASFYDQTKGNPNGVDMFDGPPGMIRMISIGDDGSADSIILDPDHHYYVNANLHYQQSKRRDVDRQAFIDLAGATYDAVLAAVGAD